jgi:hypothetical protein
MDHGSGAGSRGDVIARERIDPAMSSSVSAEVVTVYMALDGGLHHSRCSHRLSLHGQRAGQELELDFYCLRCAERVTIAFRALSRIPVAYD